MKKFNYLLLAILLLVVGLVNVEAKTYTNYKKGDKITINVNDTTKLDFYVIEDSSTENVTAIYDGVLGEDFYFGPTTNSISGSTAESKLNELTSGWTNPTEIRLVKANEIISGIEITTDTDKDFSEPSYYNIGKSYWTQDVVANGDKFYPLLVTSWISYSNLHTTQETAPSSGGAIRPVITIAKEYVVGGVLVDDLPEVDDTNWKKLKEGIKNNEAIGMFNNDESNVSFDETDDSKFIIKVEQEGKTYLIALNYKDGIMTYEADSTSPAGYEFVNSMVIGGVLQEYCKLFDYDTEAFMEWLEENEGKLTLVGNGITYSVKEYKYEDAGEGYDYSFSGDYFDSLSINIAYPLTGFTSSTVKEEEKEPNPSTGDLSMIALAGTMLLCSGATFVAYRKSKLN